MRCSIIVPVRWSGPEHARLFTALAGQQLDGPFEIIAVVLDGGAGRDGNGNYPAAWPERVKVVHARPSTPGLARNEGARLATGEFLLFIDDDCFPPPDWAARLLAGFAPGISAVAGSLTAAPAASLIGRYLGAYALPLDEEPALFRTVIPFTSFGHTANLAVRRADFEKIGGFDPKLRTAEDHDLCYRLIEQCGALRRLPDITVEHRHRATLSGMLHQAWGCGAGQAKLLRRYWPGQKIILRPGQPPRRVAAMISRIDRPVGPCTKFIFLTAICFFRWWLVVVLLLWLWRLGGQIASRLRAAGIPAATGERLPLALLHLGREAARAQGYNWVWNFSWRANDL